jgi:LacI family transcriptional regulator
MAFLRQKRVTHKDVAARAGVSVATVSYVINNGPRRVADETRERVEEAIAALGYYPSEVARALRLQQSSTVGLVIPNSANPFYAEIARELERACTEEGLLVLLCNSDRDPQREKRFVHMLRAKQVDGVVITPHGDAKALLQPLLAAHIPVVVLEHAVPGVHCIAIDDLNGGRIATQHLIDLCHRRIGVIRHETTALSAQRQEGYRMALAAAGIPYCPELVITSGAMQADGYTAMQDLLALPQRPTAVFTHNDITALGAMRAIYDAGLRVPEDVSIVGYDDITAAAYLAPPLTTVRSPKTEMGVQAARTLLQLVAEPELPAQMVTLPVELIVRASTTVLAGA